jgi:hypothetical protein
MKLVAGLCMRQSASMASYQLGLDLILSYFFFSVYEEEMLELKFPTNFLSS